MKTLIKNNFIIPESEITDVVTRVKALIINSNNEILLGYSHNIYQFPGGHVEKNEKLEDCIYREIKEETGIVLKRVHLDPFACLIGYHKDWLEKGRNRKAEIYYYEIKTDEKPNIDNVNYTKDEKEGNFSLKYIPLENIENELINNAKTYENSRGIANEMIEIIKLYKNQIDK